MKTYRSAPQKTKGFPSGISYIIGNEAAERFSFYGMKTILAVFMTNYLVNENGDLDPMSEGQATVWVHAFVTAVYFTPLLGSFLADAIWGKYKTIIYLSVIYCLGHLSLAIDESRYGLMIGLSLIAIGAGGIKGCVSAHVGDQFCKENSNLLEKVYGWFYLSINLGAFISTILTPWLLKNHGPGIAFGVPGILMFIATLVFWCGRNDFAHIAPRGREFISETFFCFRFKNNEQIDGYLSYGRYVLGTFDQTASKWVFQAENMDRQFLGVEWLPSQIQAVNPALILILIPIFFLFFISIY